MRGKDYFARWVKVDFGSQELNRHVEGKILNRHRAIVAFQKVCWRENRTQISGSGSPGHRDREVQYGVW
jgi:hypothetical protein